MKGMRIWFVCAAAAVAVLLLAVTPIQAVDGTIYPGDTIKVTVLGEQDLTRQVLVDASGKITMPLIGEVAVVGKTPAVVADEMTTSLKQYIKRPQVTVEVAIPAKRNVAVGGAVKTPGLYPIESTTRLVDLLSLAGGHQPNADLSKVTITHSGSKESSVCNLQEFFAGRNPLGNVLLVDGDSVNIPELGTVFVTGQVKAPGAVLMSANMTVRQAIERAGGMLELADKTKVLLKRANDVNWLTLDQVKILQGDPGNDLVLANGDEVDVPGVTQIGTFTITSGVRTPGAYPITGADFRITNAISSAGGLVPTAKASKVSILRGGKSIPVDLAAVYAGKAQNVAVLPNDSISVPESDPNKDPLRLLGPAATILRWIFGGW